MAQYDVHASLQAVFRKTPKGDEEIATRACHLSARLRSVLIMVDGKIVGAELLKRASVLGDGPALVGALVDGGFIEAAATTVHAPAAFGAAHRETVRFASHFLLEVLGPASDAMGARIEACRDPAALASLLESFRETIRVSAGKKQAEDFWSGVTARLP
jgi:hypothetical protein